MYRRGAGWMRALPSIAGIPSRLVNLFDTAQAYSGHVIIETYRQERWGAIDTNDRRRVYAPGWPAGVSVGADERAGAD